MGVILVGIDFSANSRHAVDEAARIAREKGHRIVLVHAFTQSAKGLGVGGLSDPVNKLLEDMQMEDAMELSTEWAQPLRAQGIDVELLTKEASARSYLVDCIEHQDPDLVVIGHHGRGGLSLGSVAKRVLDRANCPVLVIPDGAVEESK